MKLRRIYIILLALCAASCANIQSPSGGPPDKVPPVVVRTDPAPGATNFRNKTISITFSKWMNKSNALQAISIQPEVPFRTSWSGKELEIDFQNRLADSTTYALMLSAEMADYHGNQFAQSYTLVFSTGSRIDFGRISGKVAASNPSGNYVFVYKLGGINPDTLNPARTKPDYKVLLGSSGAFDVMALKDGKYRLIALKDVLQDDLFSEETDSFGTPTGDVTVSGGSSAPVFIRLGPGIDRTGPRLFSAEAVDRRHVSAEFSEELDERSFSPDNFMVADSTGKQGVGVIAVERSLNSRKTAILVTESLLDTNKTFELKCVPGAFPVADTAGNRFDNARAGAAFKSYGITDPTPAAVQLAAFPIADTLHFKIDDSIRVVFSSAPKSLDTNRNLRLIEAASGREVRMETRAAAGREVVAKPAAALKYDTRYSLEINLAGIEDFTGNKSVDTVLKYFFHTEAAPLTSSISGRMADSAFIGPRTVIRMLPKDPKGEEYRIVPRDDGSFSLREVKEGFYTFEAFIDLNGNGKYDYGCPWPYSPAEPYKAFEKEMQVKGRWNLDNIIIK